MAPFMFLEAYMDENKKEINDKNCENSEIEEYNQSEEESSDETVSEIQDAPINPETHPDEKETRGFERSDGLGYFYRNRFDCGYPDQSVFVDSGFS